MSDRNVSFSIRGNTCVLQHQRSILLYWAAGKYSYLRCNLALWWDNECFILFSGRYFICNMPYVSIYLTIIVRRSKRFFKQKRQYKKVPDLSKALSSIIIIIHKENVPTPKASSNSLENDLGQDKWYRWIKTCNSHNCFENWQLSILWYVFNWWRKRFERFIGIHINSTFIARLSKTSNLSHLTDPHVDVL